MMDSYTKHSYYKLTPRISIELWFFAASWSFFKSSGSFNSWIFLRKKKRDLERDYIPYRVNHISWWKEELPSQEEMEEGRRNLDVHGWNIDFIVTHCCSDSTQDRIGKGLFKSDILTKYLEEIKQRSTFTKWFFGHYHDNCNVNEKEILLYEQIIRMI